VRPSTALSRTVHLQHEPSRPHVYLTTGVKLRGPERSEGHVSFNFRVMQLSVETSRTSLGQELGEHRQER
jgi:hypothetical protein